MVVDAIGLLVIVDVHFNFAKARPLTLDIFSSTAPGREAFTAD